jgi:Tfp pilus assembly protein PilF
VETPATVEPVAKPVEQAAVPVPAPRAAAQTPAPDAPIRITTSRLKLNPALTLGFEALNNGNLGAAQGDYAQVLKAEPKNADALHGMAAIAVREGRYDEAEQYYLRSMEADPKDAIAQAGLYGLRGQVDPVSSESRLKSLIASQPDQPSLQFALGNVYAGVGRWSEAQQAFFKAYTGDPDHPDYLFNLAISLDHLRQTKLAAQYYNQALAAAANRPASFDKAQATARLRELQQ